MSKLTDAHIEELDREGFIIVPDFVSGDKLQSLQAAQRRVLGTNQIRAPAGPGRPQSAEVLSP